MLGVDSCSLVDPSGPLAHDTRYNGTVEATIVNEGSERREGEVTASIGGVSLGGKGVELPAGDSTTLTFNAPFRTPRVSAGESRDIEHVVEVVEQSVIETGNDGGGSGGSGGRGGSGGGGGGDTGGGGESSLSDVSFVSVSPRQDRVLAGNTNGIEATLRNDGPTTIFAGIEAEGSTSFKLIDPGERADFSVSIGPYSSTGRGTATVTLTDGSVTGASRTVSFEVERDFTDPDPNPPSSGGGGGGGGGSGGGGGGGGGSGQCGPDERYSSSIGECIPDCPQGKAFFPGLGCSSVTSLGIDPDTGEESPALDGLYGGARRAVIYGAKGKKKP
jgi:hypothetical protein